MYYNNELHEQVKKQRKQIIYMMSAIVIAFIAIGIAVEVTGIRTENATLDKLSVVPGCIGIAIAMFVWGLWGSQIFHYERFIYEILTGQKREETIVIFSIATDPVYKDNKLMYYEIKVEDKNGTERVLLYDANQGEPPYSEKEEYHVIVHGHYILGEQG